MNSEYSYSLLSASLNSEGDIPLLPFWNSVGISPNLADQLNREMNALTIRNGSVRNVFNYSKNKTYTVA